MPINIYTPLAGDGIESEELKLYNSINSYRAQYGLPAIALSKSLSLVANRHVRDLQENIGYLTHAWSDAPYSSNDSSTWPSMWTAPQRFNTPYPGYGYENAYWHSNGATATGALQTWQKSSPHNSVILNLGIWADNPWNAIGIGIYGNFAVMWVGEEADPAGSPIATSPSIDPVQYGASYSDLIQAYGYNPTSFLNHYNNYGKLEGRHPDLFDELRYLASNHDLISAFGYNPGAATKHYIQYGFFEKRSTLGFQSGRYIASNADLINAFGYNLDAATKHYIEYGFREGRSTTQFQAGRYLASYADLINAFGYNLDAATKHYVEYGFKENRSTNLFNPTTYLNNYADLTAAFGNNLDAATQHYIEYGYREGRSFVSLIQPDFMLSGMTVPASVSPGHSFAVGTNIYNVGTAQTASSQIRFYLSSDAVLDSGDLVLGTQSIPNLSPNGVHYSSLNVTRSYDWGTGRKYILAKADYNNGIAESNETNNFSAHSIDLISPYVAIASPNGGNSLEIGKSYAITWNDNITENVKIGLYQNSNLVLTIADSTPSDGNHTWTVPSSLTPGSNYRIRIDSTVNSSLFDYSDSFFQVNAPALPDLGFSAVSFPSSITVGDSVVIGTTVLNQGSGNAGSSYLRYYLSNNATLDANDFLLGEDYVDPLGPTHKSNETLSFIYDSIYGVGTKYLLFVADAQGFISESNEANNINAYAINVVTNASINVTSPSNWGSGALRVGQTYNLTWSDNIGENVRIDLFKGNQYLQTLTSSTASDGSYYWVPPTNLLSGRDYQIKITSTINSSLYDFSNNFAIDDLSTYKPFNANTVFGLNSNLGANHTIYLDFDGHTTTGTYWNTHYTNGSSIITPAYDTDGNPSSFSTIEREQIWRIWQRVSEDFAPFDVNVTTALPTADQLTKSSSSDSRWGVRVVIGGDSNWTGSYIGGKAQYNSFNASLDVPAFVFSKNLSSEKSIAESISHEVGHTLGLEHDGAYGTVNPDYYEGHGAGATGWAPIMGIGSRKELTQWSKGEYTNATNQQNDLDIIVGQNGFGYRLDDHSDSLTGATDLFNASVNAFGIIEKNTDFDYFKFWSSTGVMSLAINPFLTGPNLDILAKLYNANGQLVGQSNPLGSLSANFDVRLSSGLYYLSVTGIGEGSPTTGYSDYGSLGQYSITGNVSMPLVV